MDRIEMALLKDGDKTAVELIVAVRPGREVRFAEVTPLQPVVAFRGTTRIAGIPRPTGRRPAPTLALGSDFPEKFQIAP